jgi:rod shape-determining protein MreC
MKKKPIFVLISIFFLFYLTIKSFFLGPGILESTASYLVYPAVWAANAISRPIKSFFKNRKSYSALLIRCTELEKKRESLLHALVQLKSIMEYTKKSAELCEFKKRYSLDNAILSKILLKNFSANEHSITINRGSRDGVEKNMAAIYKFQLVGRVSQVFPCYSKITLITDRRSKISSYANTSNTKGITEGTNSINTCHLRYISHLKTLHKNDLVFSSGQGLVFPEGFCLGKIVHIETGNICHQVVVQPLVDFKTLEMCHLTNVSKMNIF